MMAEQRESQNYPDLQTGMLVVGTDDREVGTVLEAFRGVGSVEAFGTTGIPPQQEGFDPVHYAYSEAMPGTGEDYVTVESAQGVLYVPFSAIERVKDGRVVLAVEADSVPLMNW